MVDEQDEQKCDIGELGRIQKGEAREFVEAAIQHCEKKLSGG